MNVAHYHLVDTRATLILTDLVALHIYKKARETPAECLPNIPLSSANISHYFRSDKHFCDVWFWCHVMFPLIAFQRD